MKLITNQLEISQVVRAKVLHNAQFELICPITHELMKNPVTTCDGHSYEETSILEWFELCRNQSRPMTSPVTGLTLENDSLTPNLALRSLISAACGRADKDDDVAIEENAEEEFRPLSSAIFTEFDRLLDLDLMNRLGLKTAQIVALGKLRA